MNKQEREWQQESDAHTLAEAEVVKKDPARLKGAKTAAVKMAKEQQARADALSKVSGIKKDTPKSQQSDYKEVNKGLPGR